MIRIKNILIIIILAAASLLTAEDNSSDGISMEQLVRTAAANHPELELLALKRQQILAGRDTASQIPNPELNTRLLYDFSEKGISGEYGIVQTLELGGKRSARVEKNKREIDLFDTAVLLKKQEIAIEVILTFYRLRQITDEISMLRRAAADYRGLLLLMKRLPALNPERSAGRDLYQLALRECADLEARLKAEEMTLLSNLEWASGVGINGHELRLPSMAGVWPEVEEKQEISGPMLNLISAEKGLAETELKIAESLAWPDLKAGPVISHSPSGDRTAFGGGLVLSLSLPVFHRNSGEVKAAEINSSYHKLNAEVQKRRLLRLRSLYVKKYRFLTEQIAAGQRSGGDGQKRDKLISYMNRGVLPPSMLTEYNRQELELTRAGHAAELQALEILWSIHAIDGVIFVEAGYDR